MLKLKQLDNNQNIQGKRVLLRVDFNVPLKDGSITETSRIEKVLPTINFLIKKKAKIIIISHLGRPKGKTVPELTLRPISKKLSKYLNQNVNFLDKNIGEEVIKKSNEISDGEVLSMGTPKSVLTRRNIQKAFDTNVSIDTHPLTGLLTINVID